MRPYLIPEPRIPSSDDGYLDELAKNIFRVGFNWRIVEERWVTIREAFDGFQIEKVAAYDAGDVARLLETPQVIRHRKKILAIIDNAKLIRALCRTYGSFALYLGKFRDEPYPRRRDRIAATFRHVGKTAAFCFLYCVGEDVPNWDERFTDQR